VFKNNIIYTGANDGMLHAFDAETGEELFAYVPNLVFENLSALADRYYQHRYYVDLTPTIRDIPLSGVNTTMLICGLGKGGRGYFALDLTGLSPALGSLPASESALDDRVMWEYPDAATDAAEVNDLGYSFSKVSVVESNDSAHPTIIIFGNGYNSPNGNAVLFILDPVTGDLVKRIDTGVGTCNGLSTPVAVDVNDDNKVDYVYAGDLKGNLWKFDLSDTSAAQWDVAYKDVATPKPLFQTPNQPITTKPSVMYHCDKNGYLVAFGTGRYLGLQDLADFSVQAVYGIWDYGDDEDDAEYVGAFNGSLITDTYLPSTVSLLQQIVVDERTAFGEVWRTQSAGQPDWQSTTLEGGNCGLNAGTEDCDPNYIPTDNAGPDPVRHAGWYFNLPESGERVVSDVRIRGGRLTVISYVATASTCGLSGHSWVAVLDPCTGGRLPKAYFDLDDDGDVDFDDMIDIGQPDRAAPTAFKIDGKVEMPTYLIDGNIEIMYLPSIDTTMHEKRGLAPEQDMSHWRLLRKEQ
jgi:Tfp pilus tip-associated adhesin PilY1